MAPTAVLKVRAIRKVKDEKGSCCGKASPVIMEGELPLSDSVICLTMTWIGAPRTKSLNKNGELVSIVRAIFTAVKAVLPKVVPAASTGVVPFKTI